jgi:formaldehyde-activating enzyme involved in methanogenesis
LLGHCMRQIYEDEELRKEKSAAGKERVYQFDYKTIGNLMKKALEYEPTRPKADDRDSK